MLNKRLLDGQFDECDVTLAELHRIEQSVVKSLCALYHGRIAYPSERQEDTAQEPQESVEDLAAG